RAARGHGRTPGHRGRRQLPAAATVHGHGHPEPDRARGHVPAARGPARPLPAAPRPRLPGPRQRTRDPRARPRRGARRRRRRPRPGPRAAAHPAGPFRGSRRGAQVVHGPGGRGIHRAAGAGDAPPGALRRGARSLDRLRRQPARHHRAGPHGASPCLARGTRLRHAGGRAVDGAGHSATPPDSQLRGRGRGRRRRPLHRPVAGAGARPLMAAARALAGTAFTLADLLALRHAAKRLALGGRTAPTSWRAGARASRIRGRGMTFVESRPYDSGDDARLIDWRVTARTGRPHTKVFEEEKERAVFVVAQFSPSMYFGTRSAFKHVIAAELAAVVGWAAMAGGDLIGGLLASAGGPAELRPAAGRRALMTLFNALAALAAPPAGAVALLSETLSRAVRVVRTGAVVFVAGDFYDFDDDAADHL